MWERTGAGPTWTEVGDALGWPPALQERIIQTLARGGVLTYSTEPRSLAVADHADEASDVGDEGVSPIERGGWPGLLTHVAFCAAD